MSHDHFHINLDYGPRNELGSSYIPPGTEGTSGPPGKPGGEGDLGFRYFSIEKIDPVTHFSENSFSLKFKFFDIKELTLESKSEKELPSDANGIRIINKVIKFLSESGKPPSTHVPIPVIIRLGGVVDYVLEDPDRFSAEEIEKTLAAKDLEVPDIEPLEYYTYPKSIFIERRKYKRAKLLVDLVRKNKYGKIASDKKPSAQKHAMIVKIESLLDEIKDQLEDMSRPVTKIKDEILERIEKIREILRSSGMSD